MKNIGFPPFPKTLMFGERTFRGRSFVMRVFLAMRFGGAIPTSLHRMTFRQHRTSSPIRSLNWQNPHTAAPFDSAKYISARPYRWNLIKVRPRSGVRVLKNVKYFSTVCARCGSFVTVFEPNCTAPHFTARLSKTKICTEPHQWSL